MIMILMYAGDLNVSTQPTGLHHLSFLNTVKNFQIKQTIPGEFTRWEFSPDGTRLATLRDQGIIQIFPVTHNPDIDASVLHSFRSIGKISTRISWSFNGKWILVEGPHWFQVWSQVRQKLQFFPLYHYILFIQPIMCLLTFDL
jgi:hypothetical protein